MPGARRAAPGDARSDDGPDDGSAVVDFALVGALLALLAVGVVQLALLLHVRSTLVDCATEGARYAALADREPADGAARTRELVAAALGPAYARDVTARTGPVDGLVAVVVEVRAPVPVAGLLAGPRLLTATGTAAEEGV